jgi:colanic acid biosynthesis glycosyl transferase WcaI
LAQILFVEQFYYPDGWGGTELPRDVTSHLQRRGHQVSVLCGSDQYVPVTGDPGPDPASLGIRILRTAKLPGQGIHGFKALRQLFFYVQAIRYLAGRPPDIFVAQTNPPLIIPLVALAARWWGRPLVVIAQDLYPEALLASGLIDDRSVAARVLQRLFSWAYRRACKVIALGGSMAERLATKGVLSDRIEIIRNWATGPCAAVSGADNRLRVEWGLEHARVVLYSGNLGRGHEFETLLDAFERAVRDQPSLKLVIIGQGARLAEVRAGVSARQIQQCVLFKDPVPASRLPESMGLASLAIVSLRQGFAGLLVPSKVPGYMARGLPVLYIGPPGDISQLIDEAACGQHCLNGEMAAVAAVLTEVATDPDLWRTKGESGKRYYEQHLSRERSLDRYAENIEYCLRSSPA